MTEPAKPSSRELARWRQQLLRVQRISWRDLVATLGPVVLISAAAIAATLHFIRPAPPMRLAMSGGTDNSNFRAIAEKYREILARNGIELRIVESKGSLDNLYQLTDHTVDIAMVQSGVIGTQDLSELISLGTMFRQPLTVFYRAPKPITRLAELDGKRVVIGGEGSGTRFLALALLKDNGIEPGGSTQLLDMDSDSARQAIIAGQIDALFISGDSASIATTRELMHADGVRLFDFVQGEAYERRFRYLSQLKLPAGTFDLGENLPPQPVTMLAPSVEMLAHSDLHPALSDLLVEAAHEVHGKGSLMQNSGEFPAPVQHDYPIGKNAARYYKSGKGYAYEVLPFWLASLVSRAAVILVPILVVLIPGLRYAPNLYGWRVRGRIYKRYGELMTLERAALEPTTPEQRKALVARLDEIEKAIIAVEIPGAFADQIYVLRRHIQFVREHLARDTALGEAVRAEPGAETTA